jgi:Kef-type K+ transport system membrane component KefB
MYLMSAIEFSLPLKNPVLIFSLILFIVLFAPLILNKFKIPPIIGLIIAGALIGPNGLNFMLRDSSIVLFGTVGLLYIMFLAGLEIDMADFKKNSWRSIFFGLLTFLIPMGLGTAAGYYVLQFALPTSILLASMFASHTLIAYPLISKLGLAKNRAVNVTVGGTLITDTLALLVLAVIAGMSVGEINDEFWIRLGISVTIFGLLVMLVFPLIARWYFKRFDDNISQYIFVLGLVFLGAFLAEAAGIEGIIGAFLAGLALNRLIPHTSPLMNRIEFVGNALFIPFFLIGVGMLIDYRAFFKDFETIKVAIVMTVCATVAKFIAAWLTQKTFRYSLDERRMMFGLSNAQAAATLAAVLVGYNIITGTSDSGEPIRLLSEEVLNGTILMILATCTIGSFAAQKGAMNIVVAEKEMEGDVEETFDERVLIPVNNQEITEELVNLGLIIKSRKNKNGLVAINVLDDSSSSNNAEKQAKKVLEIAEKSAAAADNRLKSILEYDFNVVNGIVKNVWIEKVTDIILGLTDKRGFIDTFFGNITEGVLSRCETTTLIYSPQQPISTVKRHVIIVPPNADREIGFSKWLTKVSNIGQNTGASLIFYSTQNVIDQLGQLGEKYPINAKTEIFEDWDDFLILAKEIKKDDNIIVVMSRKGFPSYRPEMKRVQSQLLKYFKENSFIMLYPLQTTGGHQNRDFNNPSVMDPIRDHLGRLDSLGRTIGNLVKRK